jgi:hypothetical protein
MMIESYTLNLDSIALRGDMSTGKLILFSGNTEQLRSELRPLIDALREIQLIGEPLDLDKGLFLTGELFLQHISFVGCSTNVCLTPKPDSNGEFCHIAIKGPFDRPRLIWDSNCRPPRCPACKKPMANWQSHLDLSRLTCPHCNRESQLEEFAWRRQAGYGTIFIEISNIFPGEARPVHGLLEKLNQLTETQWGYFFMQS